MFYTIPKLFVEIQLYIAKNYGRFFDKYFTLKFILENKIPKWLMSDFSNGSYSSFTFVDVTPKFSLFFHPYECI